MPRHTPFGRERCRDRDIFLSRGRRYGVMDMMRRCEDIF